MLIPSHDSARRVEIQMPPLVGDPWTIEVVPRLPPELGAQARALKALQRVRGLATPYDLLRGLLADVLGPLSTRRLGAWAMLVDLADIAEAAWRKRLRTRNPWLLWLLSELVAPPPVSPPASPCPAGRLLLVDASCLRQPGGTGDDWRRLLADDFSAGRMSQGHVTDRRGGERLDRYLWQADDVIVADRGYGYRRSVALAVRPHAAGVVRLSPATFPLATEAGAPFNGLRWLRHQGSAEREGQSWCRWEGRRYRVRLAAAKLDAQAALVARRRARRQAQMGRSPQQIGRKGLSNHRWIVGGKLCLLLNQWGLIVGWDCATANVAANTFQWLIRQFEEQMIVLSNTAFHAAEGDPANLTLCQRGEWEDRILVETVLSMLTLVCPFKKVIHRAWSYFHARLAFTMAAFNILAQWHGFQPNASGFVPLSIAEFSL